MSKENFNLEEEQRKLVLARLKTLKPESKILLGGDKEVSVMDLLEHVEKRDDFGKNIVRVQMKMLQILAKGVQ